jgi:hypothetical protein
MVYNLLVEDLITLKNLSNFIIRFLKKNLINEHIFSFFYKQHIFR